MLTGTFSERQPAPTPVKNRPVNNNGLNSGPSIPCVTSIIIQPTTSGILENIKDSCRPKYSTSHPAIRPPSNAPIGISAYTKKITVINKIFKIMYKHIMYMTKAFISLSINKAFLHNCSGQHFASIVPVYLNQQSTSRYCIDDSR